MHSQAQAALDEAAQIYHLQQLVAERQQQQVQQRSLDRNQR